MISRFLLGMAFFLVFFYYGLSNSFTLEISLRLNQTKVELTGEIIELEIFLDHSSDEKILYEESDMGLEPALFFSRVLSLEDLRKDLEIRILEGPVHRVFQNEKKQNGSVDNSIEQELSERIQESFTYTFQIFEVESFRLGPIEVMVENRRGQKERFYSPYTYIHLLPPRNPQELLEFRDIAEEFSLQEPWNPKLLFYMGITLLFLLGGSLFVRRFLIFLWVQQDTLKTPEIQALKNINRIQKNIGNKDIAFLYKEVVYTVKLFLERTTKISFIQKNTQETLSLLEDFFLGKGTKTYRTKEKIKEIRKKGVRRGIKRKEEALQSRDVQRDLQRKVIQSFEWSNFLQNLDEVLFAQKSKTKKEILNDLSKTKRLLQKIKSPVQKNYY